VAVAQMTSTGDHEANFVQAASLARDAAAKGCALVCLPECFSFIGLSVPDTIAQVTLPAKKAASTPAMWLGSVCLSRPCLVSA